MADAAVKRFCKRTVYETQVISPEYPVVHTAATDLWLLGRPLRLYGFSGTLISGQPTMTGMSQTYPAGQTNTTSILLTGMPAVVSNASANCLSILPSGTSVLSINSGTQVTFSQNATQSGTFTVWFGLAVWLDPNGRSGFAPGAFPASSQLTLGIDFYPWIDQPDGSSKSSLIKRLGGGPIGTGSGWDWWWGGGWGGSGGTITVAQPPRWPWGQCVQVAYSAGLGAGAATPTTPPYPTLPVNSSGVPFIPADLTWCVNMVAGWLRVMSPVGVPIDVSGLSQQVDRLLNSETSKSPELSSVRGILRGFREFSI